MPGIKTMSFLSEAYILLHHFPSFHGLASPLISSLLTCSSHVNCSGIRRASSGSTTKNLVSWVRNASSTSTPFTVQLAEVRKDGSTLQHEHSLVELSAPLRHERLMLPPRDLKIFFRSDLEAVSSNGLMPRPAAKCYLLELEHIKVVCLADKCFVLHPENTSVQHFIHELSLACSTPEMALGSTPTKSSMSSSALKVIPDLRAEFHRLITSDIERMDFEHVVLEQALSHVTARFSRHVWLTKPALEMLLQQISLDPSNSMMRRLLAFRKSLGEFESSVQQVHRVLQELLKNDEDLHSLYLTSTCRAPHDHSEVELLVEAYFHDLVDILCDIRSMKDMVEETNQFIHTHLDTVRNRMIRMSLFMEMGTLSLASGAVVAGVFGMNLTHGFEESPIAFYVSSCGMAALMLSVFGGVAFKYARLVADTSRAHSFKALKNFFYYVDELDRIVEAKGNETFSKSEFKEVLCRLTGTKVTDEEADFIFKMFDVDKDGQLAKSEMKLTNR